MTKLKKEELINSILRYTYIASTGKFKVIVRQGFLVPLQWFDPFKKDALTFLRILVPN